MMAKNQWCVRLTVVVSLVAAGFPIEILGESASPKPSPASQSWRELSSLVESSQSALQDYQFLALDLGSQNFSIREKATKALLNLGLRARKPLREAIQSPDPEVRFRAREILDQVPPLPNSWEIRSWLGGGKTEKAFEVPMGASPRNGPPLNILLSILEAIEDESLRLAIHCWLVRNYAEKDISQSNSDSVSQRALRAFFKGYQSQNQSADTLDSKEALVLYYYVRGRYEAGKAVPIATLAELIPSLPVECQHDLESILLTRSAKTNPVTLGTGSRTDLANFVAFWTKDKQARIRLTDEPNIGKKALFVCEFDGSQGGRLCKLEEGGSFVVAQTRLQGPNDFHILPGEKVLVAERNSSQITLRNIKGDICWSWQAPSAPIQCKRLEGGKTFFATFTDIGIVNSQGRLELSLPIKDGVRFATPTLDHCFLVLNSRGELLRLDARGTILNTISHCAGSSGSGYWGHVITRANGNLIVAFAGTHTIAEISPKGDLIRQASVRCPVNVKERDDGGLWVCSFDSKSVVELDPLWVQTRKIPLEGRPFGFGRMD